MKDNHKSPKKEETLGVRIEPNVREELRKRAREQEISESTLVRKLIKQFLSN